MIIKKWLFLRGIIVIGFIVSVAYSSLATEQKAEGVVLYDFFGLKNTKDLSKASDMRHRVGIDFGPWRAQEPKRIQWIECRIENIKLPKDRIESFLTIFYSIPGKDSANGMFFKLHGRDYTPFTNGDLVVRMCQLKDLTKERGGTLPTDVIVVEMKVVNEGKLQVTQLEKTFSSKQKNLQNKYGSFDLSIPLIDFGDENGKINLKKTEEFCITFNNRITPVVMQKGVLGIQSILLIKDRISDNPSPSQLEKRRMQVDAILKTYRSEKKKEKDK